MGTKKASLYSQQQHKNMGVDELKQFHAELIHVTVRDGTHVPMLIKYDRRFYNEDSPWLFFTKGVDSHRADVHWKTEDNTFMSRGIVCAYPLLRGTNYFDQDWLSKGTAERKLSHISDLIDTAIFVKEKQLTERLGVIGHG